MMKPRTRGKNAEQALSKRSMRRLRVQIEKMRDPTRYIVGDPIFSKGKHLRGFFYMIDDDMYAMSPAHASPIKSIAIATAIQAQLNTRHPKRNPTRKGFRIFRCRISRSKKLTKFAVCKPST